MLRSFLVPVLGLLSLTLPSPASAAKEAPKKEIRLLFLGNSFTARHDIPDLVEAILEEG